MELGNHILQRSGIAPHEVTERGVLIFEDQNGARVFDHFMDILENGMGKQPCSEDSRE
jgi:hypothetical protein